MQQVSPATQENQHSGGSGSNPRPLATQHGDTRSRPELALQPRPAVGRGCHLGVPERTPHYVCPVFILFHNSMCLHIGPYSAGQQCPRAE